MSKTEIIDAAKALLWEGGYESMSPRKVMDASGAGQGSLYHHFRSKKQLAEEALAEIEKEMTTAAESLFSSRRRPLAQIESYLKLERNGLKGCRLGRLGNEQEVVEDKDLRQSLTRYFQRVEELLVTALQAAQEAGELSGRFWAPEVAAALIAIVQGGFVLSRASNDPNAIERATNGAWIMLKGLKPKDF
jgi:AcrR family transcriptional regulator